eukprot:m.156453 g.156453  ORF g.156453 m.156453 type:complete len:1269 (+) comp14323_c1_seq2:170-3976(+)
MERREGGVQGPLVPARPDAEPLSELRRSARSRKTVSRTGLALEQEVDTYLEQAMDDDKSPTRKKRPSRKAAKPRAGDVTKKPKRGTLRDMWKLPPLQPAGAQDTVLPLIPSPEKDVAVPVSDKEGEKLSQERSLPGSLSAITVSEEQQSTPSEISEPQLCTQSQTHVQQQHSTLQPDPRQPSLGDQVPSQSAEKMALPVEGLCSDQVEAAQPTPNPTETFPEPDIAVEPSNTSPSTTPMTDATSMDSTPIETPPLASDGQHSTTTLSDEKQSDDPSHTSKQGKGNACEPTTKLAKDAAQMTKPAKDATPLSNESPSKDARNAFSVLGKRTQPKRKAKEKATAAAAAVASNIEQSMDCGADEQESPVIKRTVKRKQGAAQSAKAVASIFMSKQERLEQKKALQQQEAVHKLKQSQEEARQVARNLTAHHDPDKVTQLELVRQKRSDADATCLELKGKLAPWPTLAMANVNGARHNQDYQPSATIGPFSKRSVAFGPSTTQVTSTATTPTTTSVPSTFASSILAHQAPDKSTPRVPDRAPIVMDISDASSPVSPPSSPSQQTAMLPPTIPIPLHKLNVTTPRARALYNNHYIRAASTLPATNLPWCHHFAPRSSIYSLGNAAGVAKLRLWLQEWKQRSKELKRNRERGKKQSRRKSKQRGLGKSASQSSETDIPADPHFSSDDADFVCEDDSSELEEEAVSNVLVISGPTGCGKTAAIQACATELGYQVLEMNSSDTRTGREVTRVLTEATQSHRVKSTVSVAKEKKGQLLRMFSMPTRSTSKESTKDKTSSVGLAEASLVVLEDVDVLVDEEKSFWTALNSIARKTKRPILITSTERNVCASRLKFAPTEIQFHMPSKAEVAQHCQMLVASLGFKASSSSCTRLVRFLDRDIRRCFNTLQLFLQGRLDRPTPDNQTPRDISHFIESIPDKICQGHLKRSAHIAPRFLSALAHDEEVNPPQTKAQSMQALDVYAEYTATLASLDVYETATPAPPQPLYFVPSILEQMQGPLETVLFGGNGALAHALQTGEENSTFEVIDLDADADDITEAEDDTDSINGPAQASTRSAPLATESASSETTVADKSNTVVASPATSPTLCQSSSQPSLPSFLQPSLSLATLTPAGGDIFAPPSPASASSGTGTEIVATTASTCHVIDPLLTIPVQRIVDLNHRLAFSVLLHIIKYRQLHARRSMALDYWPSVRQMVALNAIEQSTKRRSRQVACFQRLTAKHNSFLIGSCIHDMQPDGTANASVHHMASRSAALKHLPCLK